jgi:hypothetical protein
LGRSPAVAGLAPYPRTMARGRADIANTALRIFLQEMGAAYDEERGLTPYRGGKDFDVIKSFFGNRCCYCDIDFATAGAAAQDHLIPMNKTNLGLHAWGNIVPACPPCNAKKQGSDWRDFIIERAGAHASERHTRVREFLNQYSYRPSLDLSSIAEELYEEVGSIAMTLITAKVKRIRSKL